MHKKHKIYNKTTQTKQQQKNTHTVLSLDSSDNQHDTSSLAKSLSVTEEIQLFKLRIIYQQYISKMLSILKIVHTRPNVSSRQLPPYSNSGKLLTTDSFTHAYWHVTAIIQTIKRYHVHSTLSRHQLQPSGEPHMVTSSRDALASASE